MRKTRRKRRSSGFTNAKKEYLTYGKLFFSESRADGAYQVPSGTVNDEIIRDIDTHGADVIASFTTARPCLRPWCWWIRHSGLELPRPFHLSELPSILGMDPTEWLKRKRLLNSRELIILARQKEITP